MKIEGAIFDMDGTLVDSLGVWKIVWASLGEHYLGDSSFYPDEETDKLCRTQTAYEDMIYIHNKYGFGKDADEVYKIFDEIVTRYYKEQVELKRGTRELLEYLSTNGVKMSVATASPMKWVNIALDNCDIRKYFKEVLTCEEVGKNKAFPDVFLEAARRMGTSVEGTYIFEDSLTALKTAKKAGFPTVGIYDENNYGAEEAEKIVSAYIGKDASLADAIEKI